MTPEDSLDTRALRPGSVVGNYLIQSVLGQGGFGITYLAEHRQLGRKTALKECLPSDLASRAADTTVKPLSETMRETFDWAVASFMVEARTLAGFEHPNIVPVYEVFEANGTGYMATKYIDGQPLHSWAASFGDRLPAKALDAILGPVLDALEVVHGKDIVHRDIKPDNILVTAGNEPILIDFGAARQTVEGKTRTLTAVLTPGFAPLEQYDNASRQGPWTDLYALSATVHRILRGTSPQPASVRILEDSYTPLSGDASLEHYPLSLRRALDQCLRPLPRDRPQSVGDFRKLLEAVDLDEMPTVFARPSIDDAKTRPVRPGGDVGESIDDAKTRPVRPGAVSGESIDDAKTRKFVPKGVAGRQDDAGSEVGEDARGRPSVETSGGKGGSRSSVRGRSGVWGFVVPLLILGALGFGGWYGWQQFVKPSA